MRIRKRLASSFIPTTATLSDPHPHRSEAAPLPSDQPSHPPNQPSGQSMAKNNGWIFPKNDTTQVKMKQKEFGDDETWRSVEEIKPTSNDIREIVRIFNEEENINKTLQPSSSSADQGDNYEVVPLKKRKGSFSRNPNEAKMKSKTNKKCGDDHNMQLDQETVKEEKYGTMNNYTNNGGAKKSK